MQSESVQAATGAANVWIATGNIVVPAGVAALKKVIVGVAPNPAVAASALHLVPVFRLLGAGLLEQSPHQYTAQGADCIQLAATISTIIAEPGVMEYDVDIPVQTGGIIEVQHMNIAEALPGIARCELVFSAEAATPGNNMSDFVTHVMPVAAAVWEAVGIITVPTLGAGASPKKIKRIDCGFVMDSAGAAAAAMVSSRFRITGSGVAEGGNHHYLGTQASTTAGAASTGYADRAIITHEVDVPVNAGGQILVEQIIDLALPAGGDSVFGVQYA